MFSNPSYPDVLGCSGQPDSDTLPRWCAHNACQTRIGQWRAPAMGAWQWLQVWQLWCSGYHKLHACNARWRQHSHSYQHARSTRHARSTNRTQVAQWHQQQEFCQWLQPRLFWHLSHHARCAHNTRQSEATIQFGSIRVFSDSHAPAIPNSMFVTPSDMHSLTAPAWLSRPT